MGIKHVVNSKETADFFIKSVLTNLEDHGHTEYRCSHGRTPSQNNAMHLWFGLVAETLNAAGLGQKAVVSASRNGDIPNTKESVKEIYKAILKTMNGKESTSEQTTVDPSVVFEVMCQFFADRFQIALPDFPSKD